MYVIAAKKRDLNELFNIIDQRTLIVSGFGYLIGKQSDRLVIRKKKEIIAQYSMANLDELIITSRGVALSTSLINDACRHGMKICIWNNNYPNVILSSPQLAAFAEIKRAQFNALNTPVGLELIKDVLESKISNQAALLKYSVKNRNAIEAEKVTRAAKNISKALKSLEAVPNSNLAQTRTQLLNIEATAAHAYWQAFPKVVNANYSFKGRDPKGQDVINVALNYGYAILYSLTWMCILNAGLEPFAGFLHTDRPGKASLVLDLSEPFKPRLVDKTVLSLANKRRKLNLEKGMLDDTSKHIISNSIISELGKREIYSGRKLTIHSIIQRSVYSAANALKIGGRYEKYLFKW